MTRGRAVAALVLAAVPALAVGFAIKDRCTTHVWDGYQYRTSCYNDIYALYSFRGLDRGLFPYVDGDGIDDDADGDLEYPVGTGLFVGAVAAVAEGGQRFFRANTVGLGIAGLIAVGAIAAMAADRRRVLFIALAPPVALYAFHNWDLLAVALMCLGLLAFHRGRDGWSGVALGLGAATKLFPGAIVPVLLLARWRERRTIPLRLVLGSAAGFLALNLPVAIANPQGWLFPWRFQATRFPNFETSWYMAFRHLGDGASADSFWWRSYPRLTGLLSGLLFLAALVWLLVAEARRERVRPYATSFGVLLAFLLTGKVFSPQFALWLLPFFALVRVPWVGFAAFALTDAAVWLSISRWFLTQPPISDGDPRLWFMLVEGVVWARYAVLLGLLVWSRRARENVGDPSPEGTVATVGPPVQYPA